MKNQKDPTPTSGKRWPTNKLDVYAFVPRISFYRRVFRDSVKAWNDTTNFKFRLFFDSTTTGIKCFAYLRNKSDVDWAGLCVTWYNDDFYTKASIYLNKHYLDDSPIEDRIGCATHELGHCMCLDHTSQTEPSIMRPTMSDITSPQSMDIEAINNTYPNFFDGNTEVVKDAPIGIRIYVLWHKSYDTIDQLYEAADIVIEGVIDNDGINHSPFENDMTSITTKFTVNIRKIYKGYLDDEDDEVDSISFVGLGSNLDGISVDSDVTPILKKHDHVILFLKEGTEDYRLINENTSVFIKENDAYRQQSSGKLLPIQDLSEIIVK
ncbi:hypothetical protein [Paenibacillus peoriae]|uniref:hypothetical protein n=1 Tax=Paenibacillus peoriae TaxID=59893 RepID=UPI0006A73778|nr:hypothetical protein [Paenibacillus peoriae]